MKSNKIIVSVCCLAYNHESYIRKCLEGFLIQKTDFPFEILIHDDASTDGTEEIIREYEAKYPNIIKPLYEKENQWQKGRRGSAIFNFPRARGKYIALCEGDDYWTDPYKLQKQVDFLEENPEYGMVHTDYDRFYTKTGKWLHNIMHETFKNNLSILSGNILEDLLMYRAMVWTGTVCFRKEFVDNKGYQEVVNQNFSVGDFPLWCWIAAHSKLKYLDDSTAVRQLLANSATQGNDFPQQVEIYRTSFDVVKFFIIKYNLSNEILLNTKEVFYSRALEIYFRSKNKKLFVSKFNKYKNNNFTISLKQRIMNFSIQNNATYIIGRVLFAISNRIRKISIKMNIIKRDR